MSRGQIENMRTLVGRHGLTHFYLPFITTTMRHRWKEWKNLNECKGTQQRWTRRIIWYCTATEGNFGHENIRLNLETPEGKWSIFPGTEQESDRIWEMFKAECPPLFENYGVRATPLLMRGTDGLHGRH